MHDSTFTLARPERLFIVLVALLQGLLLYVADYGHSHDWWPFSALAGRVPWTTLVLVVPTLMLLSVRQLRDPRFWQHAISALLVYGALSTWAVWSATGDGTFQVQADSVLGPFAFTLFIGSFVLLPWLQVRLIAQRWAAPYPLLFELAWQNALSLILAGIFSCLSWGLLWLWGALFKLIGIHFFADLFVEKPFIYLASGLLFGLGILIGRTQERPVRIARQILFALFTGLLPVVMLIALLFLASLPFTGLDALWGTRSATFILAMLLAHMVVFLNAVVQDGSRPPPYPHWLRRAISIGLMLAPIFAVLAIIALGLRIGQYGWTVERFWAAIVVLLLAAWSTGYALAVFSRGSGWLPLMPRVNIVVSLLIVAIMLLANSPLLDPYRLAVNSQLARVHAATSDTLNKTLDVEYLRWELGRRGVLALQQLRAHPAISADAERVAHIDKRLAAIVRWGGSEYETRKVSSVEALRDRLRAAPGADPLDDALLEGMLALPNALGNCLNVDANCLVFSPDANRDGSNERLLCDPDDTNVVHCALIGQVEGQWALIGELRWWSPESEPGGVANLRKGEIQTLPECWSRISVGGMRPQELELTPAAREACDAVRQVEDGKVDTESGAENPAP